MFMLYLGDEFVKKIVDSGSNSNGRWVKFADGTMICTKTISTSVALTTAVGSLYYGAVELGVYPQSFIDIPTLNVTVGGNKNILLGGLQDYSNVDIGGVWIYRPTSRDSLDIDVFITAVGRWK